MGATCELHPGAGGEAWWAQEKEHVGTRHTQEKAKSSPCEAGPSYPPTKDREGQQVPGKSTSSREHPVGRPSGHIGGRDKSEPSVGNRPMDVGLGELGRQELQDPEKWNNLLGRQCPTEGATEDKGGGRSEPPPTKEREKKEEKRSPGKDKPGGEGPPGKPPGDGGDRRKEGTETKYLTYSPVCCSCNRQGVEQLKFREEVKAEGDLTFCTRVIREGSTTRLGVCLMASNTGLITTSKGKLCGHVVCPHCLVTKRNQSMCPCCARKLESQGAAKGGSGPLPKKETPPAVAKVKSEPPRSGDSEEGEGHRGNRAERRAKRPRGSSTESREARYRRREQDPTSEEEEPTPPMSGEEENPPGANRASGARPRPKQPPEPARGERRDEEPDEMEDVREELPECIISCCNRFTQPGYDTCCEPCEASRGRRHSQMCDRSNKRDPPPRRPEDWEDSDGEDRDKRKRGKGKGKGKGGKGKGKNSAQKSWNRYSRDQQRWRDWKGGRSRNSKPLCHQLFKQAMSLGVSDNTRRSTKARLNTWDTALKPLETNGLIDPVEDMTYLTPELVKAGVAYLKAKGYRSAELYLSAAMMRHRAKHEVSPPLAGATREATRVAKRGRGPACGKMPIDLPQPNDQQYRAIMTGIWYLLRISELIALDVGDVHKKQGPNGWQVAVHVRQSKTDQEAVGEYVARECICGDQPVSHCPVHLLWKLVEERAREAKELGGDPARAPLFVTEQGRQVTKTEMRQAVEEVAAKQGRPLQVRGRNQFGTHSLRTTGAILAFTSGIHEEVVKSLGRWKTTKAMYCYLRGTPLAKSAEATRTMARWSGMRREEPTPPSYRCTKRRKESPNPWNS